MTLRTSLFNKGIYKSTIKRFCWGSVVYFVLLFLTNIMPIFLKYKPNSQIDHSVYVFDFVLSMLMLVVAVIMSVVIAMQVYGFLHSTKHSIFIHSIPVSKNENFISSMLGGLTLIFAPVVLNGFIMCLMSLCGYGEVMEIEICIKWMAMNLANVFILFAYSTLSAVLTGNTLAVLVINVVIYVFPVLALRGAAFIIDAFVYGYPGVKMVEDIGQNIPVNKMFEWIYARDYLGDAINISEVLWNILFALIVYVISFFLYKNRKTENTGNVAAFKKCTAIYKYIFTVVVSMIPFMYGAGIYGTSGSGIIKCIIYMLLIGAVVYFGAEMALQKKTKVYKSYKGYLGYAGVMLMMMAVLAFTSVFGYETRVPDVSDIKCVSLSKFNNDEVEPFMYSDEMKEKVTEIHREILEDDEASKVCYPGSGHWISHHVYINYRLKNGLSLKRYYEISSNVSYELEKVYAGDEYRKASEEIFSENLDEEKALVEINGQYGIEDPQKKKELIECIRKDISELNYSQMDSKHIVRCTVPVYIYHFYVTDKDYPRGHITIDKDINTNYKNTVQWMKDNGYWDKSKLDLNQELYIFRKENIPYDGYCTALYKISEADDLQSVCDFIYSYEVSEHEDDKYYSICWKNWNETYSIVADIKENDLPSLLNLLQSEEKLH